MNFIFYNSKKIKKIENIFFKKILNIMKISAIILIIGMLHASAEVYSQNGNEVSVNLINVTLPEAIKHIESKTDYLFIFNPNDIGRSNVRVSIAADNQSIEKILDALLKGTGLEYTVRGRHLVLHPKKEAETSGNVTTSIAQPASIRITGTVIDAEGETLPGVTVMIKGTSTGTTTGSNGEYSLTVPDENAILSFSFLGFQTKEVVVGSNRTINITLEEDSQRLEELVVVGYGIQSKASIVASIVQVSSEELMQSGNVTDVRQALAGRLPGVITTMSTGEPGGYGDGSSATSIFIRGRNTWNNAQPLILVDGMERNIENVDMSEIETISVLKDASATAVYGVKGANGVLLITTKRGLNDRPVLSFSYDATALMVSRLPEKLDSYDALRIRNESIERDVSLNANLWADYTPYEIMRRYRERDYPEYEYIYPNVDWENALFKDVGWSHRASLNIRGGTNFVKYFGSLSYLHEGDMFREYDNDFKTYDPSYAFNRFNFRSNFDFNFTKTTVFKVNLSGFFSQKNTNYSYHQGVTGGNQPLVWAAAYRMPPDLFVPQYPDGTWGVGFSALEEFTNPVAMVNNLGVQERKTTALNADFALEQKLDFITQGLSLRGVFYYDNSFQTIGGIFDVANATRPETAANTPLTHMYRNRYTGPEQDPSEYLVFAITNPLNEYDWIVRPWNRRAEETASGSITRRMVYQVQLNYARRFARHNVGGAGVFKREEFARGSMFPTYREDWIFRATYDYDSRYFFETNGSYNGTDKFSPDYRFGFFPSFAGGWYVSNEEFFNVEWLNRLKLRYSIGWVGEDSGGARWMYVPGYSYGGSARLQSQGGNDTSISPYQFYRESTVANPDANWEKAKKVNYGLEIGILKDFVSINFDYFSENRTDIMLSGGSRAIPPYFGNNPPAANLGKVDASGFELQVNLNGSASFGLNYWVSAMMTHTRNKVVFRDDPLFQFDYIKAAGYPIGQTRTTIRTDIYQNWDDVYASVNQQVNNGNKIPGFYNIIDFNGDGLITDEDMAPYGYPDLPENTYNLTLGASYKGFSATVQFYGVTNVTRHVPLRNFYLNFNTIYGHALDYWSKDNPNATSYLPRYLTAGSFYGDYHYYDGSYVRLKTAEIAYNFQKPVLDKLGIANLKLFVNGNNLWLWTRLPDDREDSWNGGAAADGAYPTLRRINFGFNVTF